MSIQFKLTSGFIRDLDEEFVCHENIIYDVASQNKFIEGCDLAYTYRSLLDVNISAKWVLDCVYKGTIDKPLLDKEKQIVPLESQIKELTILSTSLEIIYTVTNEKLRSSNYDWRNKLNLEFFPIGKILIKTKKMGYLMEEKIANLKLLQNAPYISTILAPMPQDQVNLMLSYL